MHKRKVYIRADGNSTIGLGHLVRCIALGHMLINDFTIIFVFKDAPDSIIGEIDSAGFLFIKIQEEGDFTSTLKQDNIVILDHYGLDINYQVNIKEKGCKLVCIDDLHDKIFFADLIINHAPGVTIADYCAQDYTKFALGLDYVLLRPRFLNAAEYQNRIRQSNSVLICFGGSDPNNLTEKCLDQVIQFNKFERINVVVGAAYERSKELKEKVSKYPLVHLSSSVGESELLNIMINSDYAIVPSSGIAFEAIAAGCKVISSYYVDNQIAIFKGLKDQNAIIPLSNFFELLNLLNMGLDNISTNFKIDGKSGVRILNIFKGL